MPVAKFDSSCLDHFNGPIGNILPVEFEKQYYEQSEGPAMVT